MKMPRAGRTGLLVAAVALAAMPSWTAPTVIAQEDDIDCEQEQTTQLAMNICAGRALEASRGSLEELLAELSSKYGDSPEKTELLAVQEQWERFRDLDCEWEAKPYAGGSVEPLVRAQCLEAHNRQRIDRLKIFLCEGGGMTGPCEASKRF